jgi:hypothetical protein
VEQPKGLHGREGVSSLWFVQAEGERELVNWDCYVVHKNLKVGS